MKKCCFIGHRKVENERELEELLEKCLQRLIDEGVREFLFGSRSEFDTLCHRQVTKLKEKYPDIKRIAYTCKSEYACNPEEKEETERWLEKVTKRKVEINAYEGKEQSERLQKAGKASYVERNEDLINASDYCVFYYNAYYDIKPNFKTRKG